MLMIVSLQKIKIQYDEKTLSIQIIGSKQKVLILGSELFAWNSSPNVGRRP